MLQTKKYSIQHLPSEFFLARAVSATESSERLAFIGCLPLLATSVNAKIELILNWISMRKSKKIAGTKNYSSKWRQPTEILSRIIDFVHCPWTITTTLTATRRFEIARRMQWLTFVTSNRWKSRHKWCVVLEARWRSPN